MAIRPSRSWYALTLPALLIAVLACNRDPEVPAVVKSTVEPVPPVQAEPNEFEIKRDAQGRIVQLRVGDEIIESKAEGDVSFLSRNLLTGKDDPSNGKMMYNLTTRGLQLFGRSTIHRSKPQGPRATGTVGAYFDPTIPPDGFNPDMSAERYEHFNDNPFKAVKGEEALSTISTAVDTASYANARARINEGQLPTKDSVRIADFVNYFPYEYAKPKSGEPVAFKIEMAPCPWNGKHHLLRVGLKAKVIEKEDMPARNLVFLVDTSGSMNAPNRLPLVQESLRLLVEQLTERDRVSIVSYAGDAGLRLAPAPGNKKDAILDIINGLSAGGSTNGEGGIKVAYEQAEKTFLKDGVNRVILATDGDFNVGVSDPAELTRLIEGKRKTGVYLTVLGYGMGNLQDETLEQLAHHGNGHYAYIDSLDEAKKVFVEQGGALVTVAKDVKLQIEFNPAKVAAYRLIGYENRVLRNEDFRDDAKDAGDMGSGHTCTALYEIVPNGESVRVGEVEPLKYQTKPELTPVAKNGEWLTVRMRYKHPETDKASEVSDTLAGNGLAKDPSADLRFAGAAAAFGMILRASEHRGEATLEKVLAWAKPAIGSDNGGHRAEFVRLVEKAMILAQKIKNE